MNLEILQGVADLLAVTIPLIAVSVGGLLLLSRSRLGQAIAQRIAGNSRPSTIQEQVDSLHDALAELRNQLSDMQERVDFAERLLSRAEDNHRELPQGVHEAPLRLTRR
jgi:chromosome segregation ATPase